MFEFESFFDKTDEIKAVIGKIAKQNQNGLTCSIKNHVLNLGHSFDYAQNFGYQWTEFQTTQYDSCTGHPLSENRLILSSGWHLEDLRDKLVLEIGSGAGRFTEILSKYGAHVISIDLSSAI